MTVQTTSRDTSFISKTHLCLLFAIGFGVALRLRNLLTEPMLWADESFSVAVSQSPLLDVLLATLRFDTHPPLYYLQLHFWGAFGQSDVWMLANSFLFSLSAIALVFWVCSHRYGVSVALWAAAIMAIMPQQFFFADNVRMYGLSAVLTILLWDRLERRLENTDPNQKPGLLGISILGILLTLSHGLGFFVAFFVFLQALARSAEASQKSGAGIVSSDVKKLTGAYFFVAVFAAYSLVIGSFRDTPGQQDVSLDLLGVHLAISLLGHEFPYPQWAGLLAAAVLFIPPLSVRRSRSLMLWLVLLPMATLLVISLAVKPVFLFRTIGLFQPFLVIALALAANQFMQRRTSTRLGVFLVIVFLAASAINHSLHYQKSGYQKFAIAWSTQAPPDAVFISSGMSHFWGMTRYLDELDRYSALYVQPPVRGGMQSLKRRLDGTVFGRLGFFGQTDRLQHGNQVFLAQQINEPWLSNRELWLIEPGEKSCSFFGRETDRVLMDAHQVLHVCQ